MVPRRRRSPSCPSPTWSYGVCTRKRTPPARQDGGAGAGARRLVPWLAPWLAPGPSCSVALLLTRRSVCCTGARGEVGRGLRAASRALALRRLGERGASLPRRKVPRIANLEGSGESQGGDTVHLIRLGQTSHKTPVSVNGPRCDTRPQEVHVHFSLFSLAFLFIEVSMGSCVWFQGIVLSVTTLNTAATHPACRHRVQPRDRGAVPCV